MTTLNTFRALPTLLAASSIALSALIGSPARADTPDGTAPATPADTITLTIAEFRQPEALRRALAAQGITVATGRLAGGLLEVDAVALPTYFGREAFRQIKGEIPAGLTHFFDVDFAAGSCESHVTGAAYAIAIGQQITLPADVFTDGSLVLVPRPQDTAPGMAFFVMADPAGRACLAR